ncbi:sodium channel protein 60E [Triangularia verruculosa]|uniref:Sodium channel protein 60E n=1 Tax=Triangularia verruculosa TaxID=2587418 RepID=A0AAN6X9J6_9PEZI|nr:sodium channel protein 60E [Triangularia verruculosa]
MANSIPPSSLTTLLSNLASIDRRLSRIEAALKIGQNPNFGGAASGGGVPVQVPVGGSGVPGVGVPGVGGAPAPAGPPAPGGQPPPPPQPQQNQQHPQPTPQQQQQQLAYQQHALTQQQPQPPIIPLEPPPPNFTINSRAAMQATLDAWTLPRGYSMRIAGAKVTGKRKVRWVCFRGGEARHHRPPVDPSVFVKAKEEGRRKPTTDRTSKKCGCLFKFEVIETAKDSDVWVLHYPNEEHKVHNHGPSTDTSDPRARKLPDFVSAEVDGWLREGRLVSQIQDELRRRGFVNVLNTDLYNRKRLLKKGENQLQGGNNQRGGQQQVVG